MFGVVGVREKRENNVEVVVLVCAFGIMTCGRVRRVLRTYICSEAATGELAGWSDLGGLTRWYLHT